VKMNFENRVAATRKHLTASEQKSADYILANPQKIIKMGISDLAKASGTSAATVSRLVKSLQIESFTAMKMMISADLAGGADAQASPHLDITANESFASIGNRLIKNEMENVNQTKELLSEKACDKVVSSLLHAGRIYVFGVGASALAARNIYQKWTRVGCNVLFGEDMHVFLAQLTNAGAHDVLWLISNSGETPECLYLADWARKHGIAVIALTM
ncbi:MurR/RpiR family transcriptional regulator, partial [Lactobacillus sp. XV13L]|nr:MurR/RpiR family transcriptional regulator [Lactobacillus sp. XV13L]